MIDRIQQIEAGLKIWRCIILVLTILMLAISIVGNNQMSIIVLIICFFALILFQLKTLPITSYQLFILLQLAYFVYLFGKLFEDFYMNPSTAWENAIKDGFYMITLVLFMTILWRHYQKDQLLTQLNIDHVQDEAV